MYNSYKEMKEPVSRIRLSWKFQYEVFLEGLKNFNHMSIKYLGLVNVNDYCGLTTCPEEYTKNFLEFFIF